MGFPEYTYNTKVVKFTEDDFKKILHYLRGQQKGGYLDVLKKRLLFNKSFVDKHLKKINQDFFVGS